MSTLRVNNITDATGGSANLNVPGTAKAWVNFNGTGATAANQTVRASLNVSSVYKNGTGDYTVNFTTALVDASYTVTFGVVPDIAFGGSNAARTSFINTQSTASVRVQTGYQAGSGGSGTLDFSVITVAVFR